MAIEPIDKAGLASGFHLEAPRGNYAFLVTSWVRDSRELYWLAPRTEPPLTPAKVLIWRKRGRYPFVMASRDNRIVGYAELNVLEGSPGEYWIGHVIVDSSRRGQGLGAAFTRLLIQHATEILGATRVSLVVFRENHAAIHSYRAAGMRDAGEETHFFPAYGRREQLLRFEYSPNA